MPKREKIKLISAIVIIFLILLGGYFSYSYKLTEEKSPPKNLIEESGTTADKSYNQEKTLETPKPQTKAQTDQATLEINGAPFTAQIEKNMSVYDFMIKVKDQKKITFTEKTYIGLGKFIDEINGLRGDGSRFWIYYVNGQKAKIGVSNYKINPGDVVSWKYEKDID